MAERMPWYIYVLAGVFIGAFIILVAPKVTPATVVAPQEPVALNKEVWEWIDYRGRPRRIEVHREAR